MATVTQSPRDQFIDQMTRKLLVVICDQEVRGDDLPSFSQNPKPQPYFDHAISKGWLSKDGTRVLAAGFQTAARFLKR